jgi:hypothetical protein
VGLGAAATARTRGKYKDPISLELTNLDTGTTIVEDFMDLEMFTLGDAELTWDEDVGIVLGVADGTSTAGVTVDILSSWITNFDVGMSSASITDGVFTATGIFASLPWALTSVGGDTVNAVLPLGSVPTLELFYDIPDSLVIDTDLYQETLLIDSFAEALEVPEPGTLSLLAVGGVMLMRRR